MSFKNATSHDVNAALQEAQIAFLSYKNVQRKKKSEFLHTIADEIEALGQELIDTAMRETNLPEARIVSERGRTVSHCRMFATFVEEGNWVEARIDAAIPDRTPFPRQDIRKMLVPLGPVVVFGAANFPLAYSTAGGDTASALAAGCPVIVKAHPAHLQTSTLVAGAIQKAIEKTGMPKGVFQHIYGEGFEVGQALVKHPLTKAVGFTGSLAGGRALFDLANQREEPIPVFAEMSSVNPIILLPNSLSQDFAKTASMIAASVTLGVGQFCTNPGLLVAIDNEALQHFIASLKGEIEKVEPGTMLHQGIADNYHQKLLRALAQKGVMVEGQSLQSGTLEQGRPTVASVSASLFLENSTLAEEVFGPFSLIIRCKNIDELNTVVNHFHGQLTMTVIGSENELAAHKNILNVISLKAGRLIINSVPTGVEVVAAQNHGGPYPATTDSRFTAVGTDAIKRFARPVAFQNFPHALLPDELKDGNPLGIWRLVNNAWSKL
jgi:2,5-dioxopentanoate dehydrogenase